MSEFDELEDDGAPVVEPEGAPDPYADLPLLDPWAITPAINPVLVTDMKGIEEARRWLAKPRTLVHDFEFNIVPGYYQRRARTWQFGDNTVQFIIDFLAFVDFDTDRLWAGQGEYRGLSFGAGKKLRKWNPEHTDFALVDVNPDTYQPVYDLMNPIMDSRNYLKIAHVGEAEYVTAKWCLGIRSWNYWDTSLIEKILLNGKVKLNAAGVFGLRDLVAKYFKMRMSKEQQTTFDLVSPITDAQVGYVALDVRMPWGLWRLQKREINEHSLQWTAQIENDALPAFGDMYINGVWPNPIKWQGIIDQNHIDLKTSLDELDELFLPIVGEKVLPNPELVQGWYNYWQSLKKPGIEELQINELLKAVTQYLTGKKNEQLKKDTKEALIARRTELQAERSVKTVEVKAYFDEIKYLRNKSYADEIEKMKGRAAINYNAGGQVKDAMYASGFGLNAENMPNLNAKKTLVSLMHIPIVARYVKMKKIEKQLNTYGYRWITTTDQIAQGTKDKYGFVDPDTFRLHPPFQQLGTETGRPSCYEPNMLNLPRDKRFREAFEARDGHMNVTKDCAGQELRILTEYSREPAWIEAFLSGKDLHSILAEMTSPEAWRAAALHVLTEIIDKSGKKIALPLCAYYYDGQQKCKCPLHGPERDKMKNINFGVAYDKQAYSLSIELGIPVEEAQSRLDVWKEVNAITQSVLEQLRDEGYNNGEARTLGGRRRFIGRVTHDQILARLMEKFPKGNWNKYHYNNMQERMIAERRREAGNTPIQGSASDMMKRAMGCGFYADGSPCMWHELEPKYKARLENYVYDEFMVETPEEHCEAVGGMPDKKKGAVGGVISDQIIKAGAEIVTVVPMDSEGAINKFWTK